MAQSSIVPRWQQDYKTQVSEEFEGRVTKKLSQEYSRTENRILGALARLNDLLKNPLIQCHCGPAPETSRNALSTSQETNEDDTQSDPHPEAVIFRSYTIQNSGPEIGHDMVTGVHEEVTYCSPSLSSGKQKKNRSTSQPHFRSQITPVMIEADQILLAPQQVANNNSSAKFHNIINRISKLPKSLTTTMPTSNRESEKFELFEDRFQTSLKIHNQLTEDNRINYFHSLMKGNALQTLKTLMGQPERTS